MNTNMPWTVGEYDDALGYDCMTGGIRVGPVVLDGHDYGQKPCRPIAHEALKQMRADAELIGAAHEMRDAMRTFCRRVEAGEVRSKRTYATFKSILARVEM